MTNRVGGVIHTIEWRVGGRPFSFRSVGPQAVLRTPDGQIVELTYEEWRALARAIGECPGSPERSVATRSLPASAGRPWTADLDRRLAEEWRSGRRVEELASLFGRTVGAIEHRLLRLGLTTVDLDRR
jgi:hypothetical protein